MSDSIDNEAQDSMVGAIAIVGMAGRFPGARSVAEFWRNLCGGVESVTHFSDAELEDRFSAAVRNSGEFVKARPILDDVDRFDAAFFGMHSRETALTDPQHRLFLECAWEALEDAGHDPATYPGAIGVFAGASPSTYFLNNVLADRATVEEFTSNYQVGCYPMLLGSNADFISSRVSYKLNLTGPSLTLHSACSTSLLAVAKACQSLLLYESDMALAGGVSITFPQKRGYRHLEGGMVSADGTCRPFDADASGTLFGSGVGVVLLKRLEDAARDGDHVYAVIRGSGVNNDGASKVGFTAPSVGGQAAAIKMALAAAGVEARSISYVECHGTATPLGDPIEVAGLTEAFRATTADRQFCAVGSVKSNVGHLDAAAGIAGLIKTALALEHRTLPATLHFRRPNPQIDFPQTPFFVNDTLTAWPAGATPRRAGVSAFGVGGTNVHVVLEEPPAAAATADDRSQLLVLSARSAAALDAARRNLAAHLAAAEGAALADTAWSLQVGRRGFEHRLAVSVAGRADAVAKLGQGPGALPQGVRMEPRPRVVFLFPGQGSQYPLMGRDLYEGEPEFRRHLERCAEILAPLLAGDLRELLYPRDAAPDAAERLMATVAAQPAIFAVEYALARLWMSWGVRPDAMLGHSVGEFVAAVIAGVMSLEDALAVVATRGRLMQALPAGAMLAVRLSERELSPSLPDSLALAAVNGPNLCVVSGETAAVEAFEAQLGRRSVVTRRLHTSHAFHSPMVEPVVEPLRRELERVTLAPPSIPVVSCVSGQWLRPDDAVSAHYWSRHAREAVRFADGVETVAAGGDALLIEAGPGGALSTLALQTLRGRAIPVVTSMQSSERTRSDRDVLLDALGRAWIAGVAPDWQAVHGGPRRRVPLPTYPFERARYWIDQPPMAGVAATAPAPDAAALDDHPTPTQDDRAMTESSPDRRTHELRTRIAAILEDLSGDAPAADAATTFLEMGYDSLFLTQVAQKIQASMGVKITFRQLLGDYASIPALAEFLVDKVAPATVAAPAVTAAAAAPRAAPAAASAAPPVGLAPAGAAGSDAAGVAALFREQLQAMTQLIGRQFDVLQTLGLSAAPDGAAPPASAASSRAPAAAAPPPARTPAPAPAPAASSGTPDADVPATPAPSRFDVFKTVQKSAAGLSAEQRRHIDALIARTVAKTPGSKRETAAFRAVSADPRVAAGFRTDWKEMVYPLVVEKSLGSKLYDVDGNEYIDLVNGYGQILFGHAPPFVVEAVRAQLDRGFAIGPQAVLTGRVAQLFCELTGNERMTFCNTGSEAVMAAMRVARTVTGREKIVIFNGDYHGQFDEVLVKGVQRPGTAPRSMPVAPGIPAGSVANMIVLEYGTAETLAWIRDNAHTLAAVVAEPVQSRHPNLRPLDFLREVRAITAAADTAFIMDEVVTGFRVHPGGICAVAGIRPDLATYGKIVGGGLPVGALAGTAKYMDALDGGNWRYGDDSFPETGVTFFAGTFVRHPLLLASAWAVLNHLKDSGPQLQESLAARTFALVARLNALFKSRGVATVIETYSSWFYFNFHNEHPLATLFFYHLRERGIHIQDGFPCFLTTAHSEADIETIYAAFESSLDELNAVGILGGRAAAAAPAAVAANAGAAVAAPPPAAAVPDGPVPLTESQVEIWLAAQLGDDASCAFNESVTLRLRGRLDADALQAALDRVLARHDALRARFSATGEEMRIAPAGRFEAAFTDLSALPAAQADRAYDALVETDAATAFNLVEGPPIRAHLVRLAADCHALLLTAHHIVCDGWSINVVVNELTEVYAAATRGAPPSLPPVLAFSEYARLQAQRDAAELATTEAYWLKRFASRVAPLELPTDRPRPMLKSFEGSSRIRRIDAALYQSVKKAGARQRSTLFVTLLAAFQTLMGRLADQAEVVVGVPTAGQSLIEDRVLVGHCVNFLPLRGAWTAATSVGEHLATTAQQVLAAYEHQNYTFGTLVRQLALPREPGRLPLAEVQFNLERLADRIRLPDLSIDVEPNAKRRVNFDLFLNVIESPDGLRMECDYNSDLFDAATIDHWLDCYQALLEAFVADAAQPLVRASLLPAAERRRLFEEIQGATATLSAGGVPALIEAQVDATPDAPAAQFGDRTLTYRELDRAANRLAAVLRARLGRAPAPGTLVGVSVDRSLEMLVALLAVHKAGCAYVPLDPTHPPARLKHILGEARVAALISDGSEDAALVQGVPVIDVRREAAAIAAAPDARPAAPVAAADLAYVIFTSGSTGKPKGVEITHGAVTNLLHSMAVAPGLGATDVLYAVTTIAFDIAGLELFLPLIRGARVVIGARETLMDGDRLRDELAATGATVMQATPATWRLLLEAGFRAAPGFKLLCGGEALPRELADRLLEGAGELWNLYGPTETTIWSSCERVLPGGGAISVGRPIHNTQFYVLDQNDQPVPLGVPGQLHIGGAGVARGYYRRDELTAEKFLANPFAPGRLYRSGDLAKWLPDGRLQVLGRIDHQIKLRGFRIELGEIESVLMHKAQVAQATVILREDVPNSPRLVAYYVEREGSERTPDGFRDLLAEELPDYMIPSAWVRLPSLPLSPNGKLDRNALPAPDRSQSSPEDYVAPATPTEVTLTTIFGEVLHMDRVGTTADLLKLGADSIQIFQITARANRAGIRITAKQLLQHRTVALLAKLADAQPKATESAAATALPTLGQFQRHRRAGSTVGAR